MNDAARCYGAVVVGIGVSKRGIEASCLPACNKANLSNLLRFAQQLDTAHISVSGPECHTHQSDHVLDLHVLQKFDHCAIHCATVIVQVEPGQEQIQDQQGVTYDITWSLDDRGNLRAQVCGRAVYLISRCVWMSFISSRKVCISMVFNLHGS